MATPEGKEAEKQGKPNMQLYVKYSGLIFSMVVVVGGSGWLGYWLDTKYEHKIPYMTIILLFLGIFVSMYQIIRQSKSDE